VILPEGNSELVGYGNLEEALKEPDTALRLFGKPVVKGHRRLGVALARAASVEEAREKAKRVANAVKVSM
jgi:phosphoribosylglycinamide formyltransferase 2